MELTAEGDFVRVATCGTPTEAHLLKGVLDAAGLNAVVLDANIVQANTWMTQAVGGVRVMVPGSQAVAAAEAIASFRSGAFQLESEEAAPVPKLEELGSPIFSPDRAVLLSFLLTPIFGAVVQLTNASVLGRPSRQRDWVWLALLTAATLVVAYVAHELSRGPFVIFRVSYMLGAITVLWYFLAGQDQSRYVIEKYGTRFPRKSLFKPALFVASLELAVGWTLSQIR